MKISFQSMIALSALLGGFLILPVQLFVPVQAATLVGSGSSQFALANADALPLPAAAADRFLAAQDHSMDTNSAGHDGHEGMDMSMPMSTDGQMPPMDAAEHERMMAADRKGSELNHHLAGFFVIFAGVFFLAASVGPRQWSFLRYAWPLCFFLCGVFLLAYSDKELWPFGPQNWWYGLAHSREVLQHKLFAVILLALGVVELQRARGVLKSAWSSWAFPLLACFGSVLVLFHDHGSGMSGANHMAVMSHIQTQHQSFSAAGFCIGLSKGLSEVSPRRQVIFSALSSGLIIVLGVLLVLYTE
jgi:hypothetical protein